MKYLLFNSTPSSLDQPPATLLTPQSRDRKRIYIITAAVLIGVLIVAAVFFVPQSSANTISLGVHYTQGEKLTYNINVSASSAGTSITSNVSANSTVTIEVISIENGIYKLNYTLTSNILGNSTVLSKIVEVKESQMVTTLALLPVVAQLGSIDNSSSPLITAVFDQSTAKVGDTWSIPIDVKTSGNSNVKAENLTVTFKAIQDLTVPAGNYHVFRIDLSTSMEETQNSGIISGKVAVQLSGESYLETGGCKQIQSNLTLVMSISSQIGSTDYSYSITCGISSNLVSDVKT